jgi:hypothetical protein
MGHSYYSYQGHCPGLPGSGGKSGRLELRAKLPLFTLLPVRGLLGNPYPRSCIAPVRCVGGYPFRAGA